MKHEEEPDLPFGVIALICAILLIGVLLWQRAEQGGKPFVAVPVYPSHEAVVGASGR